MNRAVVTLMVMSLPVSSFAGHELDGRDLAQGQQLYGAHCAACHGANLEGQPNWRSPNADGTLPAPPHDETGHTWHHDNQLLFDYTFLGGQRALADRGVTNFTSGMPGFQEVLPPEGVWNILAYIRSTWPAQVQEIQATRNPPHQ
ncbi:MAG: cytochrome c [Litoreibacter sp.]|nr:cytochrome c [Litoreibacter sp.]